MRKIFGSGLFFLAFVQLDSHLVDDVTAQVGVQLEGIAVVDLHFAVRANLEPAEPFPSPDTFLCDAVDFGADLIHLAHSLFRAAQKHQNLDQNAVIFRFAGSAEGFRAGFPFNRSTTKATTYGQCHNESFPRGGFTLNVLTPTHHIAQHGTSSNSSIHTFDEFDHRAVEKILLAVRPELEVLFRALERGDSLIAIIEEIEDMIDPRG